MHDESFRSFLGWKRGLRRTALRVRREAELHRTEYIQRNKPLAPDAASGLFQMALRLLSECFGRQMQPCARVSFPGR